MNDGVDRSGAIRPPERDTPERAYRVHRSDADAERHAGEDGNDGFLERRRKEEIGPHGHTVPAVRDDSPQDEVSLSPDALRMLQHLSSTPTAAEEGSASQSNFVASAPDDKPDAKAADRPLDPPAPPGRFSVVA